MAGVNIVRIAYKGAAQGMNDVVGGRVQVMFPTSVAATPFVKSGKVRALAVTSLRPSALAPGLPTIAASGLPGYESIAIYGMFAPAGTPRAVIALLNREIERVLTTPELKEKFLNIGMEPAGGPPEALTAKMKRNPHALRNWCALPALPGMTQAFGLISLRHIVRSFRSF